MSATLKNAIRAVNRTALMLGSISTLALSTAAFAQEEGALMEEIEVTGIRGSLKQAMDTKRFSNATVDAVSAEDIGKFPDSNVAEALGRVPGVTVSRQFGEGSAVSIRGASNALTLTTLNGQNIASAGWYSQQANDRTFNYSMLAPEMIAGMDVYKSSQADLLEGGVGGTVIVKTRKPLDLDANTFFASVKGTGSTASDEIDGNLSGLYSWKNDSESFGILAAYSYNEYTLERRGDESLVSWGGRVAPTHFLQERERESFDIAAQFAPTDALTFGAHYMNMELAADSVNSQIWLASDTSAAGCNSFNAQGVCTSTTSTQAWYDAGGLGANAYWETRPRNATMETEVWDLDVTFEGDGFTLEAEVGGSEATGGTNLETNAAFITGTGSTIGSIDFTGDQVNYSIDNPGVTQEALPTAGNYQSWEGLQAGNTSKEPRSDEEVYAQVDVEFETDFGVISSIKTGLRWSDHDVSQQTFRPDNSNYDGVAAMNMYDGTAFATDDTLDVGFGGFKMAKPNAKFVLDRALAGAGTFFEDRSAAIDVNEESIAAYVMGNFEGEGFRGNIGFRYISTEASASAYLSDPTYVDPSFARNSGYSTNKIKETTEYSEVLPSVNVAFDMSDDIILRFSAAEVISRPNYSDMFNNTAVSGYGDNDTENARVVKGTPELSPFKAFQSDIGLEWYYSDGSMVSASYFLKEVSTFTTFANVEDTQIGLVDPDTGLDKWTAQTKVDGDGGAIDGVELQWQHAFDSGFGTVVNYTYANTDANAENFVDRNAVFSDSSDHTVNLVGYYENELFSARAAYSWRSEYMIRETGFYGAREHQEFGTLDLSAAWFVTDNITVTFDAVNVLEEDSIQLGADKKAVPAANRFSQGFPVASYQGEARYSVGAQFRF